MFSNRVAPLQRITTSRSCLRHAIPLPGSTQPCRTYATNRLEASQLTPTTPLAKKLKETRVWTTKHTTSRNRTKIEPAPKDAPPSVNGDKQRVNIVGEKLCDDILERIGKSLEKHKGCDLIDIYPGAGLWSSKLNEFLQPRSHIMMEPDAELYKPFLQPLLEKEGTTLVPKSGIIWGNLNSVLTPEYLPKQRVYNRKHENSNKKNDTLLVTCNLAFHPKKRFVSFDSVAQLLLHQFNDAIKNSSLFFKYGQVRLLVWVRREDKTNTLPRLMQKRRRTALDVELLAESVEEVVGWNGREYSQFTRDTTIDRASALATLNRMKKAKIGTPKDRETDALKQAMEDIKLKKVDRPMPGSKPPMLERTYFEDLSTLEQSNLRAGSENMTLMKQLKWRKSTEERNNEKKHGYLLRYDEIVKLKASGKASDEKIQTLVRNLSDEIGRLATAHHADFTSLRDNLQIWRQGDREPILLWDRRAYEPLLAQLDEFYPHVDCCLLDIKPRPVHHLIGDIGPGSTRAGESFELIQKAMWAIPKEPVDRALDSVWPGAGDWIIPRCPSFHDPAQGGVNVSIKSMELTVRTMNPKHWEELIEQWYEWPFRPEFQDLLARSQDINDDDEPGAIGQPMDNM